MATGQPRPGLSGSGMSSFSKQTWKVSLPNHNIHNILEPYSRLQICFKKINRNGVECMMILEVVIHNFFSRTRYILLELSYHSPNYICLSSLNIYRTISRYVAGWYHLYLITNFIHYHPRQKSVQPPGPSAQRDQRLEIAQGTKWHLATSSTDESDFSATKKAPILICLIKFFVEQPNPPSILQLSLGLWHCT